MKRHVGKPNGLLNIDFDTGVNEDMDDFNDSDLEAELAALTNDSGLPKRPPKKRATPQVNLNTMLAESMKDIPSDDDISVDENDPELLSELNEIVGEDPVETESSPQNEVNVPVASNTSLQLLQQRLKMYEAAEKHAKDSGETSKARRYGRGISTLKSLIKLANDGKQINNDEIPPEVKIPKLQTDTAPRPMEPHVTEQSTEIETPALTEEIPQVDPNTLSILKERHMQYKVAALKAKKSGNTQTAVNYLKIAKQFEHVIEAFQNGQPIDLSQMPGPPEIAEPRVEQQEMQKSNQDDEQISSVKSEEQKPQVPVNLNEALVNCVEFYKKQEEKAKSENNSSKARRMGRIIKQFEQAIKQNKAVKSIAVDELPVPPGFPPLAVKAPPTVTPIPSEETKPIPDSPTVKPTPTSRNQTIRSTGNHVPNNRAEQQMQVLLARQKQFKEAALRAKKKGEITQAKEFLRNAKGFDKLIEATSCGLPVDFSSLPLPPDEKSHLDKEFSFINVDECTEEDSSSSDILTRLEHQLQKQLKMCLTTRDHNKSLGDVAATNRFERLALNVTKDLDIIRLAKKTPGAGIPKFHYENKDFSIVKSFTELTDNDLEICILRGINYNTDAPKEIDTYVKFIFPWPQETPYIEQTAVVKDTNNPEYNATFMIPINRRTKSCQRSFKRHAVKFEVYSKGCCIGASDWFCCFSGWFKSDTLIGTVTVKLQNLETQCEIHESFDLKDGRKNAGGKLEIRMRLRNPILTQEVERLNEKWLIIDS